MRAVPRFSVRLLTSRTSSPSGVTSSLPDGPRACTELAACCEPCREPNQGQRNILAIGEVAAGAGKYRVASLTLLDAAATVRVTWRAVSVTASAGLVIAWTTWRPVSWAR